MVHYGKKLVAVEAVELALDHARIKRALAETATFMRYSSQIGLESADPLLGSVLQYVSILFLLM